MTIDTVPTWGDYGFAALKVVLFVALLVALWELVNALTRFDDEKELFDRGNLPYALVRVAIVLAQAIATVPLLGVTDGGWNDVGALLGWGAAIVVVLVGLNFVVDALVRHPGGLAALDRASVSSAVVKAGMYLAAGLVLHAALSGSAPSLGQAIASTAVFAVLGLVALVLAYRLLGLVLPLGRRRGATPPLAGAIVSAGVLIGLGLVLRSAIAGDFSGWGSGLLGFAVTFVAGFLGLVVVVLLVDLVLIRSRRLRQIVAQDEVLPAVVMSALVVAVALGASTVVVV
ncbi:hypothetical protein [Nakamurella deserti]|uniref:DUF350 domain-containing protein n=1 Tax=Nakamurella deserti TaxID=2164074 RepID=UPI000DBE5A04|nr:hypothetical protein [Nakamurella deserti]